MNVHFIAIGGSAMHNLAIALKMKGYNVSGSDDEIVDPSRGRLIKYGLMPESEGWDAGRISSSLDAIILGMHAREDNPELLRAKELDLPIFSYPEYLYEQSKNKIRVVIGGSHGKTSITAMILHVLNFSNIDCDFMIGAQLEGFEVMVKISEDAGIILLEGDEYLSSPIDRRPKFHLYKPNIALLSGIAWDHINVFPSWENYVDQFRIFIGLIENGGTLIYCEDDPEVKAIAEEDFNHIKLIPYGLPDYELQNGTSYLEYRGEQIPLKVFGRHNLTNLMGTYHVCKQLGVGDEQFYQAIQSFGGASRRLELLESNDTTAVYKDFAHSPSKLKATVEAMKEQYPDRRLVACMELHTFSSLSQEFLDHYRGCMDAADVALVYYNPHAIALKRLASISEEQVKEAFGLSGLKVFKDALKLKEELFELDWDNTNLLMMSSGNFDGTDLNHLAKKITGQ